LVLLGIASCAGPARDLPPAPVAPRPAPAFAGSAPAGGGASTGAPTGSEAAADAPARPAADAGSEPSAAARPGAAPLASVAGEPLLAADLLLEWYQLAPREVWLVVDKLVATRLAYAEAARLGLRLAPDAVAARVEAERDALEERLAASTDDWRGLEDWIRTEVGQEPARYLELLRIGTIRQMIAERAVRAWTLAAENLTLRLVVLPDEASAAATRAEVEGGADLAALARERSLDDSAERGGLVPFLVQSERSPLARAAFAVGAGELGGPVEISGRWLVFRVEERRAPVEGRWSEVAATVEASLAAHPVGDSEFLGWKLAMERRYPVDVEPLLDLLDGRQR